MAFVATGASKGSLGGRGVWWVPVILDAWEEAVRRCPETPEAYSADEAGGLSKQVRVIRETLGY